jgi:hypothetical protein
MDPNRWFPAEHFTATGPRRLHRQHQIVVGAEVFEEIAAASGLHQDLHVGVEPRESGEYVRQNPCGVCIDATEPHRPCVSFRTDRLHRFIVQTQQSSSIPDQRFSLTAQMDLLGLSNENREPDQPFKTLYLHAYGRLRPIENHCRSREAAAISHGDEGLQ